MSDDEKEKFEITDYDLNNEFYSTRKKLTKHQQIYGIWADDSDNEENERPGFKSRKPKNYTAPIGFVAGGIQNPGKSKNKASLNAKEESSHSEDETKTFDTINCSSESEEENYKSEEVAGLRTRNQIGSTNKNVGNWEKHTKGIGAKLLLKMGYQPGKGLGKTLQGISSPVEASLRKGRGAIGAYGPEKPAHIIRNHESEMTLECKENGHKVEHKWKINKPLGQKTRYYYRSVNDVIEKGKKTGSYHSSGISSDLTNVKVIDMTGPQQRILSGYHALSGLRAPPGVEHFEDVVHKKCSNFKLPEIQHNLNILVDICEQDIIQIDRNTRYNHDKVALLKQEQASLNETLEKQNDEIHNISTIMKIVNELLDPSLGLSLLQVATIFRDLQSNYHEEYLKYELSELAPTLVGPLITSALANWFPLSNPKQYIDVFVCWRDILDSSVQGNSTKVQPYDCLVWHTWMPVMRTCISSWSPKDCDPLITLLETWIPVIPSWILENLYNQHVLPKIQAEVNAWNPLVDTIPIHVWIHPWIPLIDSRLQANTYPIIQEKLGKALANWHPSDPSAKPMLKPWQRALSKGAFVAFLIKHIVPKLQLCMQNLVINPHQQHLDGWYWVMDWSDMLSVGNMTLILDKFFFPRWRQTLAMWLNHNPNYAEVTDWYTGWKNMLSEDLLAQPTIKENFFNALEIMNRAVNIGEQPGAKESISYLSSLENNIPTQPPPVKIESLAESFRAVSKNPLLYKDLVAKKCEEKGILFVPMPNKYYEAKQVYKIGSVGFQCYIDRNVVFLSKNNANWVPSSLNGLLDKVSR